MPYSDAGDALTPCHTDDIESRLRRYLSEGKSLRAAASLCGITPGQAEHYIDGEVTELTVTEDVSDVRALAKRATVEAVHTLLDVARNSQSDAARVAAANALLDRGYGKVAGMAVEVGEGLSKVRVEIIG